MEKQELVDTLNEVLKTEREAQATAIEKAVDDKLNALREEIKPKSISGGHERQDDDPKCGFKSLADFAGAVVRADSNKGTDERLARMKAVSGMSEGADIYGGYLVPVEYRRELWKLTIEKSQLVSACTQIPMATNQVEVPFIDGFSDRSSGTVHGGIKFYWGDEANQYTATKPKLGKLSLRLKKAMGLFYATDELLADSMISVEPMIRQAFSDGMQWTLEDVLINGTGADQPLGVLNAGCLVSVAKENLQTADTVVTENILKMYARLYKKEGSFWLINHDVFPQLPMLSIAVGTGGVPVYVPANGLAGAPNGTLLGLPVYFSEHCATLGDQGDVLLGQWSQYLIGQKSGADVPDYSSSIHLKFDYGETAFRFTFRLDGQPWWKSALTLHKSSSTLSPFVVLDARA